ncbi:hypothetical protein QBC47DRAFT_49479 [Echria macrotheca]|uniref:Zn(2)-C6 fungal-type domain-containing protein n=1 Tax=Echria macrotheca TaxID=438768 RepID=A0AAJ0F425_9PEZI|nr:hypothetical protein QBC47DRAFT_49479 [Echria macrotheca]
MSTPHTSTPKLRSACDSCGIAKVKCDRGQPTCGRCVALRVDCIYGPSRNAGKAPRKRLLDADSSSQAKRRCPPTAGPGAVSDSMNNAENALFGDLLNDAGSWPLLDEWTFGQALSFPSLEPPRGIANADSASHSCPSESYGIFRDLICPSPTLHVPEDNSKTVTAQFDEVLHFNKNAIQRLGRLLSCPCAKSGHRAMVHASIISRILIWYQQAAGWPTSSPSPPQTPSTEDAASDGGSVVRATGFAVESAPVLVGTFDVQDQTVQNCIRVQLVLSELKKVLELINAFSSSGDSAEVGGLYSHLGNWLLGEQQRTVRILKARLSVLNRDLETEAGLSP